MGFIQQLNNHCVILTTIFDIMSKIVGKEFNFTMISNIERKLEKAIDEAYGIDPKMTSAQKTLDRLQRYERHPNLFLILKGFIFHFLFSKKICCDIFKLFKNGYIISLYHTSRREHLQCLSRKRTSY